MNNPMIDELFAKSFAYFPTGTISVPFALPLCGDYCEFSGGSTSYLSASNFPMQLAYGVRKDDKIVLAWSDYSLAFYLSKPYEEKSHPFIKAVHNVFYAFQKKGYLFSGLDLFFNTPFLDDTLNIYYLVTLLTKLLNSLFNENKISSVEAYDLCFYALDNIPHIYYSYCYMVAIFHEKSCTIQLVNNHLFINDIDYEFDYDCYLLFDRKHIIDNNYLKATLNGLKKVDEVIFNGDLLANTNVNLFRQNMSAPYQGVDEINKFKCHFIYDDFAYRQDLMRTFAEHDEAKFLNLLTSYSNLRLKTFLFDVQGLTKYYYEYLSYNHQNLPYFIPFAGGDMIALYLPKTSSLKTLSLLPYRHWSYTLLKFKHDDEKDAQNTKV